jgi:hypothetical protein
MFRNVYNSFSSPSRGTKASSKRLGATSTAVVTSGASGVQGASIPVPAATSEPTQQTKTPNVVWQRWVSVFVLQNWVA